jgi:hypothetical protein
MAITAKIAREIIKFAGSKGKGEAVKKYGDQAVKDARKQMQRDARERYKKKERAAKKKGASATKKTPTGPRKARKLTPKTPKSETREQLRKGMRGRPDEAEITVVPTRRRGKVVKKEGMTRKRARDMISKQENETGEEFMQRMGRESFQGGVGTGRNFRDGDPGYAREQIDSMMRGEYRSPEETTKDVLEMMGESLGRRKKGGKVAKKKSSSKPRGVGMALRGYGRAMKGTK